MTDTQPTRLDLDALLALHAAATAPPWRHEPHASLGSNGILGPANLPIAEFGDGPDADADRALTIAARNALPALIAYACSLETELDGRDEEARERWIQKQEDQLGIRFADFRDGKWEMDLAMGREMAAAYVAMAKTLLGDAPNYTETRIEFDVKVAESPEPYTLVVQRHAPGALTPHEARQRAEARVAELEQQLAATQARVQSLAFDLATGSRVVEPAEFDAAFVADGACPHCNHRADWHTARVGEDGGVCANCMCMSPDHRWRSGDLPGVERCAVDTCRARRTAPAPVRGDR